MEDLNDISRNGEFQNFAGAVMKALPHDLDPEVMKGWIDDPKTLGKVLRRVLSHPVGRGVKQQVISWRDFYKTHFTIDIDALSLVIPDSIPGFDRLIVVARGLSPHDVFKVSHRVFGGNCHGQLDGIVLKDERMPKDDSYAVWVRDSVEPDEEFTNASAEHLRQRGIKGITLLERLLLGLKYHEETGRHLDNETWTLCAGSLHGETIVPRIGASSGLELGWSTKNEAHPVVRTRRVVA